MSGTHTLMANPRLDSPYHEGHPEGNDTIQVPAYNLPQHYMEAPIRHHNWHMDQYMSRARKGTGNNTRGAKH